MSAEDALAAVKAARVTVYVVGIGGIAGISLKGERLLKRIASETGGQVFFPPREEDIVAVHERLAEDAQNRYLVTYTPSNQVARRRLAIGEGDDDAGLQGANPRRISRAEAAAGASGTRVHDHRRRAALCGPERGRPGGGRGWRRAEDRRLPRSGGARLDRPRARSSGSMRRSAAAVVEAAHEFVAALRPEDSLAPLLFADQSVFAHDLTRIASDHQGDRQLGRAEAQRSTTRWGTRWPA